MSSLSEMLQYAAYDAQNKEANSPGGQIAGLGNSLLGGYLMGRKMAREDQALKLDRASKLLDIQKKTADLEKAAMNEKILTHLAKQYGLIDLDPQEADAARATSFDSLGKTPPPADQSSGGNLATTFKEAQDNPYKYPKLSFKPNEGLSFSLERDPATEKTPRDPASDNVRIQTLAEQAARREKFNTISQTLGPDAVAKFANVQPSQDEIQKYLPEMTAYVSGDAAKAKSIIAARKAAMVPTTNTLAAIQAQSSANSGIKGFLPQRFRDANQNPLPGIDQETLDAYKTKLLGGASVEDLVNEIAGKLKKLSATPDSINQNRDQIQALVKQKIALMRVGGSQ